MAQIELTVPDIGGFADVPVIEVLVAPGETIAEDAPLVTLESDKATMEVPASASGVVRDVRVRVGDKVSQGTVLAVVESTDAQSPTPPTPPALPPTDVVGIVGADAAQSMEDASSGSAPPPTPVTNDSQMTEAAEGIVELVVPDLGSFADVPVIEVLVAPGETISQDAPLVTLESDKATMEVPASAAGTIRDVKVAVGDRVSQGSVLATVATRERRPDDTRAPSSPPPAPSRGGASAAPAAVSVAPPAPTPPGAVANGRPRIPQPPQPAANGAASARPSSGPVHASPAVRRFARELGVDLARVRGGGPNGRIMREDVQRFVKTTLGAPVPAADGAGVHGGTPSGLGLGLPPWPSVDFARFGPVERVPLSRIQRISGPALARNWVMIPHVTQNEDADVTDLEAFRKTINGERKDVKVTMLAFLMKASIAALKRFPQFNASLDGAELVLKRYYNIGFAADTPAGLVVPVVKDADAKGIVEIARETADLAAKARDGKLGPGDMSGATFTISSLGSIGGTYFTPIINAPEVAILGACEAEMRPVWDGSAFVPRLIQPLSLSYDHRVIDGANAARFCVALKESLADLRRVLL